MRTMREVLAVGVALLALSGCGASRVERVTALSDQSEEYAQMAAAEEALASLLAVAGDAEAAGLAVDRAAEYAQRSGEAAAEAEEVAQDTGGGFGLGSLLGAAGAIGGGAVAGAVGGRVADIAEVALLTATDIMLSRSTVENVEREMAESRRDSAAADLEAQIARGQAGEAELARLRAADAFGAANDERARAEAEAALERRAGEAAEAERRAGEAEEIAARRRAEVEETARVRRQRLLEAAETIDLDLTNLPEAEWHQVVMERLDELEAAQG